MAQSLKGFLHKHEELSTSTTWQEEAGRGSSHLQIPVLAVGERMIPGAHGPACEHLVR